MLLKQLGITHCTRRFPLLPFLNHAPPSPDHPPSPPPVRLVSSCKIATAPGTPRTRDILATIGDYFQL